MTLAHLATLVVDDPSDAKPGWIPFFIVLALGAVVAFLYFSMKKQLGRINIPDEPQEKPAADEPEEG